MIHIRPAAEADFEAILQVQQAAFGEYADVYEVSAWTTETLDSLRHDANHYHHLDLICFAKYHEPAKTATPYFAG